MMGLAIQLLVAGVLFFAEQAEGQAKKSTCQEWQGVTGTALYALAESPNMIGDPSTNQWCRIKNAENCTTCACDYYVVYTSDGGATWNGVSFSGTGSGTGCPGAPAYTGSNQAQATTWLEEKYIAAGLCGCRDAGCRQVGCDGGKCSKTPIDGMEVVGECEKGSGCFCYKKKMDDDCKYDCEVKKGGKCLEKWTSQAEYIGKCRAGKWPNVCYCGYCFKSCAMDEKCKAAGGRCGVKRPRGARWTQTSHFCDKERQCKCWCKTKECLEMVGGPKPPTRG